MKTGKIKRKWICPRCGAKNTYSVKIEVEGGFPFFTIIGNPKCKRCGLYRFDEEYYKLVEKEEK